MTGSKMLFAGIRFSSPVIILAIARSSYRNHLDSRRKLFKRMSGSSPLRTPQHHPSLCLLLFRLSYNAGARSAILNSMSVFGGYLCLHLLQESDRMTWRKALGCIIGFLGIPSGTLAERKAVVSHSWAMNMIILNALCGASASLLTRGLSKRVDVFWNRLFAEHRWSLAGDSCIVNGWLSASHQPHWASPSFCCSLPSQPSVSLSTTNY